MHALLLLATLAPLQTPMIDFESGIEPLPKLLARLSKVAGVKLAVRRELRNEPVIVCVKQRSVQETLDLIATVVGAEWQKQNDHLLLVRTPAIAKRHLEEDNAHVAKSLAAVIAEQVKGNRFVYGPSAEETMSSIEKAVSKKPLPGEENAYYTAATYRHPAARLLLGILSDMSPLDLASCPLGRQRVWSTHPNKWQLPLKVSVGRLRQFANEYRQVYLQFQGLPYTEEHELSRKLELYNQPKRPLPSEYKIVFDMSRGQFGAFTCEMAILDMEDRLLTKCDLPMGLPPILKPPFEVEPLLSEKYEPELNAELLREDANTRQRLRREIREGEILAAPLQKPISILLKYFPEIVACFPDEVFYMSLESDPTMREQLAGMNFCMIFDRQNDGLLTIRPREFSTVALSRADRPALGAMITALEGPLPTVSQASLRYALNQNPDSFLSQMEFLAADLSGERKSVSDVINLMSSGHQRGAVRFLALLSAEQRRGLAEGRTLSVGELPFAAKTELVDLFYSRGYQIVMLRPSTWEDATVLLPAGIPTETELSAKVDRSKGALLVTADMRANGYWSLSELGRHLLQQRYTGQTSDGPFARPNLEKSTFLPAERHVLQVKLTFPSGATTSMSLEEYAPVWTGKPLTIEQFPLGYFEEVRRAYDVSLKGLRSEAKVPALEHRPPP